MNSNKILSSMSYFSIFFAPLLFPVIVWFVSEKDSDVHFHAGRAFKLHILPTILSIVSIGLLGTLAVFSQTGQTLGIIGMIVISATVILDLVLGVYNIYLGIKVMSEK